MNEVRYQLELADLAGHYLDVQLELMPQDDAVVLFTLPAWIPGSYMIRDFARHLLDIRAQDQTGPLILQQTDKQSWQLQHQGLPVTVRYRLYAFDLSVRANYLSADIAVINPAACCLQVVGQQHLPHLVEVRRGQAPQHWQLATGLPRAAETSPLQFGFYRAANYAQLIDCPLLAGKLDVASFVIDNVPHHLVLAGAVATDVQRIAADLLPLCQAQKQVFGALPADLDEYWFLTWVVDQGYGGLEHRNSTLLLCNRFDLPNPRLPAEYSEDYQNFLALCSHEYFHTWWVKRARPTPYLDYQLQAEQYSTQLWLYEGFTSYYDDLSLLRTGILTLEQYLTGLAKTISRLQRAPANLRQSLADSSFNAWTRFYRQDENAVNAVVSYYAKGALLAFCLDAELQQQNLGLDGLMQLCWQQYGQGETGSGEDTFFRLLLQYSQSDALVKKVRLWVEEVAALPLAEAASALGLELNWRQPEHHQDQSGDKALALPSMEPGFHYEVKPEGLLLTAVRNGTAAHRAGFSAGDVLIAVGQLKATEQTLRQMLLRAVPGDVLCCHLFRQQRLVQLNLLLEAAPETVAVLKALSQRTRWPGVIWSLQSAE
ncbi:MAG: M61 family peptidase [Rheinheimera sp.]|nr:MAG: M61 family peptidase [Rheinheimera sp.]